MYVFRLSIVCMSSTTSENEFKSVEDLRVKPDEFFQEITTKGAL